MIEEFNNHLRLEFGVLMKAGKDVVWSFLEDAENLYNGIERTNEYDDLVRDILSQVKLDRRFTFEQYREVIRFTKEHNRLNGFKPKADNDYIVL